MNANFRDRVHLAIAIVGPLLLLGPLLYLGWFLVYGGASEYYSRLILRNHIVFFGMPYAAFFAYYMVVTIESSRGPIEAELLGFKFKGAAGPLAFWVLIFLSVVLGFKLLWVGV